MEKIVKGFYRSSFSTTELDSRNRDIIYRKISVEGRRVLSNTIEVSDYPTDLNFLKMDISTIEDVELYSLDDLFIPFNTDLYDIQWLDIKVISEQEIDGVLHGILQAEILAKYNRVKKNLQRKEKNNFEINQIQLQNSNIDRSNLEQNPGCLNKTRNGCLPMFNKGCLILLFWLFLILSAINLFRKCASQDFDKINESDTTETNPLDTLKLKQEGKDSIKYIDRDNRIETIKTITLPNVQFFTNSDQLLPSSRQDLDGLVKYLLENPNSNAEIIGHTDNVGDLQKNMKLSLDRANSVKKYLKEKGIDAMRMNAIGKGPTEPRASNDTPEGRLMNRRVEVKISQQSTN